MRRCSRRDEPFALFERWFREAKQKEPNDPNGMALATADASGFPDVRMVLLKGVDAQGFVFYTNAESAKGRQLAANPRAAAVFHWKSIRRQVRVRGHSRERQRRRGRRLFPEPRPWRAAGRMGKPAIAAARGSPGAGKAHR